MFLYAFLKDKYVMSQSDPAIFFFMKESYFHLLPTRAHHRTQSSTYLIWQVFTPDVLCDATPREICASALERTRQTQFQKSFSTFFGIVFV